MTSFDFEHLRLGSSIFGVSVRTANVMFLRFQQRGVITAGTQLNPKEVKTFHQHFKFRLIHYND
jgi:hypothetical protein